MTSRARDEMRGWAWNVFAVRYLWIGCFAGGMARSLLAAKARRCPDPEGKRVTHALWILRAGHGGENVVSAPQVARALR